MSVLQQNASTFPYNLETLQPICNGRSISLDRGVEKSCYGVAFYEKCSHFGSVVKHHKLPCSSSAQLPISQGKCMW